MSRSLLKCCWQTAPQALRFLFCAGLCLLRAQRRLQEVAASEPVFVCGAFGNHSGLAQGARLYAQHCQGKRVHCVDITDAMRMPRDPETAEEALSIADLSGMPGPGTVVIHANPPQFQLAICALGKAFLRHKRVVGYWTWELETLPPVWKQALDYVDAVEVPSVFVADALQQCTQKPVTVVPHPVPAPERRKTGYATDGILRCLSIFDAGSSWERKNPLAALEAFAGAFRPGEAELTFKVSNHGADPERFARFQTACAATPGVRISTESLDAEAMEKLYLQHDVYLSLHRSEGFGLTILEAMRHGLHAVVTGWSGNRDFMTGDLAHPVPYTLTPLNAQRGPYKGLKARWAEPDVHAAACILWDLKQMLCGNLPRMDSPQLPTRPGLTPSQVAVIVLNYNNSQETLACLSSLYELAEKPGLVIVVDNNSTDESVREIHQGWQKQSDVLLLREGQEKQCPVETSAILYTLNENRGYGAGNNAGIRLAQQRDRYGAYWVLNNDTRVEYNSLQALCDVYNAHNELSIIGSTIVFLHDRQTIQCTAGSTSIGFIGMTFDINAGKKLHQIDKIDKNTVERNLKYINGCSIFISKYVIEKIGLFKENYFLYLEDTEYGLRAKKYGIKLLYALNSVVYHKEGATTGSTSIYNSTKNKTAQVDYLMIRNRTYLVKEHYNWALPIYLATVPFLIIKRIIYGRWRMIPSMLNAIRTGLSS